jgi:hypothetical protein
VHSEEADVEGAKEALVAAGAGITQAKALFDIAIENARAPHSLTDDECVARLRETYGERTEEKLAAARDLIAKVAEKWPGVYEYLDKDRLGSSPKFVRAVIERASRRRTILGGL